MLARMIQSPVPAPRPATALRPVLGCLLAVGAVLTTASETCHGQEPKAAPAGPKTRAERTEYRATSTLADVVGFLDQLPDLPHGDRLMRTQLGTTDAGTEIPAVVTAHPMPTQLGARRPADKLRVVVLADIHGGEVEGKEAVQMLLREIAQGDHGRLVEEAQIYWVPVYNPDGNDNISKSNRVDQNGPVDGVGTRPDANGFDLNRDFLKADSNNTKALLTVLKTFDPHLFLDLHTTDGSWHGYHLTYSPSLSANVDPGLDAFTRGTLLPTARSRMADQGWRTFDYGNFDRRPGGRRSTTGQPGGEGRPARPRPTRWRTYDHRPRFGTNYFGLRNRIAVLSEAYSHLDFEGRVQVTREFVLQVLGVALDHQEEVLQLCHAADARCNSKRHPVWFGTDTIYGAPTVMEVLQGDCESIEVPGIGTRVAMLPEVAEPLDLKVYDRFVPRRRTRLPSVYLLPLEVSNHVGEWLKLHGVPFQLAQSPQQILNVERFVISKGSRASSSYQGHRTLRLEGRWEALGEPLNLGRGAMILRTHQPLARLVEQLLNPESEDSLCTWGVMDKFLGDDDVAAGTAYPILRVR